MGGGAELFGVVKGGAVFFGMPKGGPEFFERQRGGDQNFYLIFFAIYKGGTRKKTGTGHHRQTAPLPVKIDSSHNKSPCEVDDIRTYIHA